MHTHLGAAFEKHEFVISAAIVRDDGLPEGIPGLSYMDGIAFDMRVARGSPGPPDGVAISRCDDRIRAVERHGDGVCADRERHVLGQAVVSRKPPPDDWPNYEVGVRCSAVDRRLYVVTLFRFERVDRCTGISERGRPRG